MAWRPEGWKNPYIGEFNTTWTMALERVAYELGADAMLEALRKQGVHVDRATAFCCLSEHVTLSNKDNTGTYLFIPDEQQPRISPIETPHSICPKANTCEKLKIVMDKDWCLDRDEVEAMKKVCKRCEEKK